MFIKIFYIVMDSIYLPENCIYYSFISEGSSDYICKNVLYKR